MHLYEDESLRPCLFKAMMEQVVLTAEVGFTATKNAQDGIGVVVDKDQQLVDDLVDVKEATGAEEGQGASFSGPHVRSVLRSGKQRFVKIKNLNVGEKQWSILVRYMDADSAVFESAKHVGFATDGSRFGGNEWVMTVFVIRMPNGKYLVKVAHPMEPLVKGMQAS